MRTGAGTRTSASRPNFRLSSCRADLCRCDQTKTVDHSPSTRRCAIAPAAQPITGSPLQRLDAPPARFKVNRRVTKLIERTRTTRKQCPISSHRERMQQSGRNIDHHRRRVTNVSTGDSIGVAMATSSADDAPSCPLSLAPAACTSALRGPAPTGVACRTPILQFPIAISVFGAESSDCSSPWTMRAVCRSHRVRAVCRCARSARRRRPRTALDHRHKTAVQSTRVIIASEAELSVQAAAKRKQTSFHVVREPCPCAAECCASASRRRALIDVKRNRCHKRAVVGHLERAVDVRLLERAKVARHANHAEYQTSCFLNSSTASAYVSWLM
jgi:hypothetical protein